MLLRCHWKHEECALAVALLRVSQESGLHGCAAWQSYKAVRLGTRIHLEILNVCTVGFVIILCLNPRLYREPYLYIEKFDACI